MNNLATNDFRNTIVKVYRSYYYINNFYTSYYYSESRQDLVYHADKNYYNNFIIWYNKNLCEVIKKDLKLKKTAYHTIKKIVETEKVFG